MKNFVKSILLTLIIFYILPAGAQQADGVDFIKLTDKFYRIVCANGGNTVNTLASVGDDGILLIDAGYRQTGEELKSGIGTLGNGNLKILIYTHIHNDHIGGSGALANEDLLIIAHKNVRSRLEGFYGQISNVPEEALPGLTFENDLTLYFNDEEIRLLYFPGHSDGDIVIHFPQSKLAFMGDLLLSNGFPSVQTNVGGDIEQYLATLKKILDYFPEDTKFIAGHGNDCTFDDMQQYYTMAVNTTNVIREGLEEGKDIDAMRKEDILKKWKSIVTNGPTADYWIGAVTQSLTNENNKPSIAEPLLNTLIESDADAAVSQYRELKTNHFDDYVFFENALNTLGYYLLGRNRIQDAIEIFKLNVEEYPEAFNVYDSLGEAYMNNGDKELAIKYYEKSLELNPDNLNAVEMIKRIKAN
ncbi:MAG: MBL fold metallo-hydrolase [Bacteroidales bacterium]|nr:MAG: MBL fold metallo-hydrolase [Bacteroidales bacterium]